MYLPVTKIDKINSTLVLNTMIKLLKYAFLVISFMGKRMMYANERFIELI